MIMLSATQHRLPAVFDGPLAHSRRQLQGLERAVPPPIDSPSVLADVKTFKRLPLVPNHETGHSHPASGIAFPRASSVEERSPGAWEPPPSFSHNAQRMLEPSIECIYQIFFSASSPQLTTTEPAPSVRVPRACAPLLPEASPSLTATSRKSLDVQDLAQLPPLTLPDDDSWWSQFCHSSQLTDTEFVEQLSSEDLQLSGRRLLYFRRSSSVSPPSPTPDIDATLTSAQSSSPLGQLARPRLDSVWSLDLVEESAPPFQLDAPGSPSAAYAAENNSSLASGAKSQAIGTSAEKALNVLGVSKDGSEISGGRKNTRTQKRAASENSESDDDNRSENYHEALVEQYRASAPPAAVQWGDSRSRSLGANSYSTIHERRQSPLARLAQRNSDNLRRRLQMVRHFSSPIGSGPRHMKHNSIGESDSSSKRRSKGSSSTSSKAEMESSGFRAFVGKAFSREQTEEQWREDMKKKITRVDEQGRPLGQRRESSDGGWI